MIPPGDRGPGLPSTSHQVQTGSVKTAAAELQQLVQGGRPPRFQEAVVAAELRRRKVLQERPPRRPAGRLADRSSSHRSTGTTSPKRCSLRGSGASR